MSLLPGRAPARALSTLVAAALIVGGGVTATSASALELQAGSISGSVTDAVGGALADVAVSVVPTDGSAAVVASTDSAGAYTVSDLAPGEYKVHFDAAGPTFLDEWWDDAASEAEASVITVVDGGAHEASASLSAGPMIAGTVPQIIGAVAVGSTLSAEPGAWTEGATLSYQWFVDGLAVAGATDPAFALTADTLGKTVRIDVTGAMDGFAPTTLPSQETARVAPGALVYQVPSISGTAGVGFTLTAVAGTWTAGTVLSYQWFANSTAIVGATSAKLVLTSALKDKAIKVAVTGSLPGYADLRKVSAATPKVATVATPKITGTAATGNTLTVTPGAWTASTGFAYQWYADDAPITAATKSTFVPKATHVAKRISVTVTGTKAGYATVTKKAAATPKVTGFSVPKITGTAAVGLALTAHRGSWTAGTTITYQWYADGAAISGATGYTFRPTSTQRDKRLTVKVTGKQSGFATVTAASAATARVATVATPSISGVYMVGSTLTAKPNTWTTGTSFAYQWFADGAPISGATRSTLALSSYQKDKQITVIVTGRKSGWSTVARTSSKTVRIAVTSAPTIGGSLIAGSTLTARNGTWSATGFTYKWYVGGALAASGSRSTFTLSKAHIAKSVKVVVVGSRSGYQTLSRSSATTGAVSSGKARPASRDNCPSGYPVKGNQTTRHTSDWIYHVPGGQYYAVTDPEECFATEAAARVWGYRASLR
ncbi:carboxypeptidase-like regulatory domain-containing protein [Microbacterium sp. CFH 31415]|uniref:sunset domain-containing protein n=1 Tax=Microbacterium sp. CFH 31415 TaxID=2921732 RepID=UPI001F12F7DA|nr:carboxypeptidase regulatory-like domain-containing protein [Microbacterium sp. CFH 31415]MCH6231853.1 carboxypeptidase-like regulatory domain-containing protein [Microbacterium sp. CFH 31415]